MSDAWPWLAVGLLGAYHGINPAMGWLFAVALGLQERSRRALLQALPPIALGHLISIALVVAIVEFAQSVMTPHVVRPVGAVTLVAFGIYKILKPRSHPRWVAFRVSPSDLVLWSFLMSTAHGAGLMLVPVVFRMPGLTHIHAPGARHVVEAGLSAIATNGGAGVAIHTIAMLATMAAVALLVFEKLGIGVLRRAWVNLDRVWAGIVVLSGAFTLLNR